MRKRLKSGRAMDTPSTRLEELPIRFQMLSQKFATINSQPLSPRAVPSRMPKCSAKIDTTLHLELSTACSSKLHMDTILNERMGNIVSK